MLQQAVLYSLTFISGLFFGSFFNLVSDRLPKGRKIIRGRSICDHCKKTLQLKDLVPVFSFLRYRGKCRRCKKKLSWYYPFSEILTGVVFVGAVYLSGIFYVININTVLNLTYYLVIGGFYITILLTDLKYKLIPNKVVYPAIIFNLFYFIVRTIIFYILSYNRFSNNAFGVYLLEVGLLKMQLFNVIKSLVITIVSSGAISLFFAFLVWITKGRGMGGGDIKLGFLIGLFNGFPFNVLAIFLGFVFGAMTSLVLIILGKKTMKDTVPFGPFLILGSVATLFWGAQLWALYINLF
jgi:leader peptidase (prepilin peptidase)/N-methyltransferase